jgi:hypothetical protein
MGRPLTALLFVALACALVLAQGVAPLPDIRPDTRAKPDTPWQVRVAYGNPSSTVLSVTWQVQRPTPDAVVEYGPTPKLGKRAKAERVEFLSETGPTYAALLSGSSRQPTSTTAWGIRGRGRRSSRREPRRRRLRLFSSRRSATKGSWSPVASPSPTSRRTLPTSTFSWATRPTPTGFNPIWDAWFDMMEPFAARIPVMPAIGNHEYEKNIGPISYLGRFTLPEDELQYTFDWGDVRFVVVNTVLGMTDAQLDWLDRALAAARAARVRWLIVCQHFPLFGTTAGRGFNMPLILRESAVLDKHAVDLVLCGHDHVYERSYPVVGRKPVTDERTHYRKGMGPIHVIAGGGGAGLYKFAPRPSSFNAVRELTHARLRVSIPVDWRVARGSRSPRRVDARRLRDRAVRASTRMLLVVLGALFFAGSLWVLQQGLMPTETPVDVETRPGGTIEIAGSRPTMISATTPPPRIVHPEPMLEDDEPDAPEPRWPDPGTRALTVRVEDRRGSFARGDPRRRARCASRRPLARRTSRDAARRTRAIPDRPPLRARREHPRCGARHARHDRVRRRESRPRSRSGRVVGPRSGAIAEIRLEETDGTPFRGLAKVRKVIVDEAGSDPAERAGRLDLVFAETTPRAARADGLWMLPGFRAG